MRRKLENFDVDMPHVQSTMHSDYDSVENIAVASERVDYESSRKPTASGKPEAIKITQKRGQVQIVLKLMTLEERASNQIHLKSH